jgi:16S rRNA (guanine966-N2)-methyltransferase
VKKRPRPAKAGESRVVSSEAARAAAGLRIVGGHFRGRKLHYSGDLRTRPMKDRLREAIFNLIGPEIRGKHAIDLFAGTGALGLEAISRGATRATLIERHNPTAALIRENVAELGAQAQAEVVAANAFLWFKMQPPGTREALARTPWAVFSSPPYDFYVERLEEMLQLIGALAAAAPAESVFIVEADERFDFARLPDPARWDVRPYPPAIVGIWRKA